MHESRNCVALALCHGDGSH